MDLGIWLLSETKSCIFYNSATEERSYILDVRREEVNPADTKKPKFHVYREGIVLFDRFTGWLLPMLRWNRGCEELDETRLGIK